MQVRKICQAISFLSPAFCMTLASLDLGLPPWEVVGLLTSGLALSSFALSGTSLQIWSFVWYWMSIQRIIHAYVLFAAGLYCTHQDISREYASILLVRKFTNFFCDMHALLKLIFTGITCQSHTYICVWASSLLGSEKVRIRLVYGCMGLVWVVGMS